MESNIKTLLSIIFIFPYFLFGAPNDFMCPDMLTLTEQKAYLEGIKLHRSYDSEESNKLFFSVKSKCKTSIDSIYLEYLIGLNYFFQNDANSAIKHYNNVLSKYDNQNLDLPRLAMVYAKTFMSKGYTLSNLSDRKNAIPCFVTSRKLIQDYSLGEYSYYSLTPNLINSYASLGQFDKALDLGAKDLTHIETKNIIFHKKKVILFQILNSLAAAKTKNGNEIEDIVNTYYLGLSYLEKSDSVRIATVHHNISNAFMMGRQYEEAFMHAEKACELSDYKTSKRYQKTLNQLLYIESRSIKAYLYDMIGSHEKAEEIFLKTMNLSESILEPHNETSLLLNLRAINNSIYLEDEERIISLSNLVLESSKKLNGQINVARSKEYNYVGNAYSAINRIDDALLFLDSAIMFNPILINQKYSYGDIGELINSIEFSLEVWNKKLNSSDFESHIIRLFELFLSHTNHVLNQHKQEENLRQISTIFQNFYTCFWNLYMKTKNEKYINRLWEISELSKSRELLGQLTINNGRLNVIPDTYRAIEKQLRDSILYLNLNPDSTSNGHELLALKRRHNDLLRNHDKSFLGDLHSERLNPSLNKTRNRLKANTAIISFFNSRKIEKVMESNPLTNVNRTYMMILTSNDLKLSSFDLDSISSNILRYNRSILNKEEKDEVYSNIGQILDNFFQESGEAITTLEIIPDGFWWDVNFAALKINSDSKKIKNQYLGQKYNIVYQYSYGLKEVQEEFEHSKNFNILGLSFNNESKRRARFREKDEDYLDLPGSRKEVEAISKAWSENHTHLIAEESHFKNKAQDYRVIHLALHSDIDTINPSNSKLILYSSNNKEDGNLYAHEINNMSLKASLVVLSACQSGGGKIESGEGLMSLARSFAIGGAKSIMASKWDVCDNSSPIIMEYFYENLKKGMRKSESLRKAQLKFIEMMRIIFPVILYTGVHFTF